MLHEKAKGLLEKYNNGTATEEEKTLVEKWLFQLNEEPVDFSEEHIDRVSEAIWAKLPKPSAIAHHRSLYLKRFAVAASILLVACAGAFFMMRKPDVNNQQMVNDIAPGGDKLILTLGNGKKIDLSSSANGRVALQGKTTINKASGKQIIYTAPGQEGSETEFNTISAPRGGKGEIVLSDGTRVWLNAESSLTFPVNFIEKNRIVKLTGEAYFEVKHNAAHPFKVETAKQTIEDIGTSFNVNAYDNEPKTATTLIEGSVKINGQTIKPGEQSDGSKIEKVNTTQFLAWKNNDFDFEGDRIETVMRQLSRWYNIEVLWDGPPTDEVFYATLTRQRPISSVLKTLEKTKGVHFKIDGRRVIVSK